MAYRRTLKLIWQNLTWFNVNIIETDAKARENNF